MTMGIMPVTLATMTAIAITVNVGMRRFEQVWFDAERCGALVWVHRSRPDRYEQAMRTSRS
jgi:hypothetical protein